MQLLQDRQASFAVHAVRFLGPNLVERLVHFGHDVEAIQEMESFGTFLADDL